MPPQGATGSERCLDPNRTVLVLDDFSNGWARVCRLLRRNGYTVILGTEDDAAGHILESMSTTRQNPDVLFIGSVSE